MQGIVRDVNCGVRDSRPVHPLSSTLKLYLLDRGCRNTTGNLYGGNLLPTNCLLLCQNGGTICAKLSPKEMMTGSETKFWFGKFSPAAQTTLPSLPPSETHFQCLLLVHSSARLLIVFWLSYWLTEQIIRLTRVKQNEFEGGNNVCQEDI